MPKCLPIAAVFLLSLLAPALADHHADGWVALFDGKTLTGWIKQGDADWKVEDGVITASEGPICLLTTKEKFENYELELEFRAAIGTNSGVFLNTLGVVKDEATDCYEVNIAPPTNGFPTGSLVKAVRIEGKGEQADWRKYQLRVQNGKVRVVLDGELLFEYTAKKPLPAGFIGLQKNRGKIAFRNIRVRKLAEE